MKKILIGLAILIVVGGVATTIAHKSQGTATSPTPSASATPGNNAMLNVLESQVSLKNPGESNFKVLTSSAVVVQGSEIKTSASGRAQIVYPNGTITTVTEDSDVEITSLDTMGSQSRLKVVVGGIWSKVKNVLGAGNYYEVETDNVVASVRGTIFATEFHNHVTNVYGVEHNVHVSAKDKKLNTILEQTGVDVSTGEKLTFQDTNETPIKKLSKQDFSDDDYQKNFIKENVLENVDKDNINDEKVKTFIKHVHDHNLKDKQFLNRIEESLQLHLDAKISNSPTTTPFRSPLPSGSPKISPTPSPTPTPTPTPTPSPSTTPTPTIVGSEPVFEYVYPKAVTAGEQFALNGKNFTTGRNIKQFSGVLVGSTPVTTNYFDSLTIYAQTTGLQTGTYSVTLITTSGAKLILPDTLTIK